MSSLDEYAEQYRGDRGFATWCDVLAFLIFFVGIVFSLGAFVGFWGKEVGAGVGVYVLVSSVILGTFIEGLSRLVSLAADQACSSYVAAFYIEHLYKSGKAREDNQRR